MGGDLEEVDDEHEGVEAEEDGRRSSESFRLNEKSGQRRTDKITQRKGRQPDT